MNIFRKIFFTFFLLTIALQSIGGELPDTFGNRLAAAKRYMDVMPTEQAVREMIEHSAQNIPEQHRRVYMNFLTLAIDTEALNATMLSVLAKHFTVKELNALAKFYGSEAGRSSMKKFGAYMSDVMPFIQQEVSKAHDLLLKQIATN